MTGLAITIPGMPERSVRLVMAMVLMALVPGAIAFASFFGPGVLIQIFFATAFALAFEAAMLKMRGQPVARFLGDLSAVVTAVLFALCLPPLAPWWISAIGMGVAIVIAKQLFGGLGNNLFNPAMAGYVAVRLLFPDQFMHWLPAEVGISGATAFDSSWIWIAAGYAVGGIFLLWKRIVPWQLPFATLGAAILPASLFQLIDPNTNGFAPLPTFAAALTLGAIFIVTDPVTGCETVRGRWIFGAGVGALVVLAWHSGSQPADGVAFAVLLMNCVAPLIDQRVRASMLRQRKEA